MREKSQLSYTIILPMKQVSVSWAFPLVLLGGTVSIPGGMTSWKVACHGVPITVLRAQEAFLAGSSFFPSTSPYWDGLGLFLLPLPVRHLPPAASKWDAPFADACRKQRETGVGGCFPGDIDMAQRVLTVKAPSQSMVSPQHSAWVETLCSSDPWVHLHKPQQQSRSQTKNN